MRIDVTTNRIVSNRFALHGSASVSSDLKALYKSVIIIIIIIIIIQRKQ